MREAASEIRRLAFEALYQLDARGAADAEGVRETVEADEALTPAQRAEAFELASAAYAGRHEADAAMERLAPGWPASRQPAVDRALLRLGYHEIMTRRAPPKIVINDAVELAKRFSTDRSPGFVNALLDKIHRQQRAGEPGAAPTGRSPA